MGTWVPQGLESSAVSCIQHQILKKPYLRTHHHSHFWTLNPQGAWTELFAALHKHMVKFYRQKIKFSIRVLSLSLSLSYGHQKLE